MIDFNHKKGEYLWDLDIVQGGRTLRTPYHPQRYLDLLMEMDD
jgi:hypothetical protein